MKLNNFNYIDSEAIANTAERFGTPLYLYDERAIADLCASLLRMPSAFGLTVRYAMKANPTRALMQIISSRGLKIDASSLNEARRAVLAGINHADIMLTTQEVPEGAGRELLTDMIGRGMQYNVCSLRQLRAIGDFASARGVCLSIRVHPGVGTGESATRNTGDMYSCFGIHLSDVEEALAYAKERGFTFTTLHSHIGSGGDPVIWQSNIDIMLDILDRYFPDADTINFGGGLRVARMPGETAADIGALGAYAKHKIEQFHQRTGRRLHTEIEPGTYATANAGFVVARVIDKKRTGGDGLNFVMLDGGMEMNARPVMYSSQHPFYVVSKNGALLSSEFSNNGNYYAAVVGRCCESSDSQCLNADGINVPHPMVEPEIGDYVAIGGCGAYCSSMSPFNYNSHVRAPEVLYTADGDLRLIRARQTFEQMIDGEL